MNTEIEKEEDSSKRDEGEYNILDHMWIINEAFCFEVSG